MVSLSFHGGYAVLNYTLITLSFVFGIISIRTLRRYDIHEAEPFWKMAFVTVLGGIISVAVSLGLYELIEAAGISIYAGKPFTFFYVGFIEELGKLLALFMCWPVIRKELNEPTDGLIYMACVALGFSLIENYFYALIPTQSYLIIVRLLICSPMHIAFSLIMGLAYYHAVRSRGGWGMLLFVYTVASIYHALYDIVVSYWFFLPGLFFILAGALSWMYRILGYTTAQSPFRTSLKAFIENVQAPEQQRGLECLNCGNARPKPTYTKGRIKVQQCGDCGFYLCHPESLIHLIRHFGSLFGNVDRVIRKHSGLKKSSERTLDGLQTDPERRLVSFHLDTLSESLEKLNQNLIRKTEKKWWCQWQ